jgi:hypothetical protein
MEAAMNPVDNVFTALKVQKAEMIFGLGGIGLGVLSMAALHFARKPKEKSAPA